MSSTASAPWPRATNSCTGSTTKSLHSTGMSTASATSERSANDPPKNSRLGEHAHRRRAAVLVVQRLLGRLAVRRDRPRARASAFFTSAMTATSRRSRSAAAKSRGGRAQHASRSRSAAESSPYSRAMRSRRRAIMSSRKLTSSPPPAARARAAAPSRWTPRRALERGERPAGVDRSRASATPSARSATLPGREQRGRRVHEHDVAPRAVSPAKHRAQRSPRSPRRRRRRCRPACRARCRPAPA